MVSKQGRGNQQLPAKFQPRDDLNCVKQHHDRTIILVGSTVRIQEKVTWPLKAKVLKKADIPMSFVLETGEGTIQRRNRQDLLKTKKQFVSLPNDGIILSHSTDSSTSYRTAHLRINYLLSDKFRYIYKSTKTFGFWSITPSYCIYAYQTKLIFGTLGYLKLFHIWFCFVRKEEVTIRHSL